MVDVLTEIIINIPIEKVSTYASNPENAPEWYVNIQSAEWKTEKTVQKGSQIAFKASFLGRELAYIYEITEFQPGEKLSMKTSTGPFPMETIYTWESIGRDVTRMTLRNRGNPTGFSKVFSPFMATMMQRANIKDLKKIKEILENR
ncbi:SRPBCC family protein [Robertmurraya korlensis]|uniref:SRPBCC family protein n=1 Tax=Robertmurraya korlensis TaxID=519977 RepID=UPI0008251A9A|nr:SRPBCC family protein [Robertmurraya korlensis]